jgi:AcrR family transcriptional regulator
LSSKPLRADALRNRARILAAAEQVFAERGAAASTEDVAARAGVAIGTVFRHFPTKRDLLAAILKDLLASLTEVTDDTDLFAFFTRVVTASAEKRFVVELLAVDVPESILSLGPTVDVLLTRAKAADAVRPDVQLDEVLALLTAAGHGAPHWSPDLLARTVEVIFAGLSPRSGGTR